MKKTEKLQKKTCREAHTATKSVWLIVLFIFISLFLVGTVSAADWDNKLYYSNNDLKVTISNSFLLLFPTSEIGTAELKSHTSVNYVKEVGAGNQVVMWYDFNFIELYLNGLGEVEFTDMRTGEEIDRNYSFVYWGEKERNVYDDGNCFLNINGTRSCETIVVGKETYNDWLPYNSKDIPKGNIRIGLMTYVEIDDKVDGVWTIAGKRIKKHAEWKADLNVGLKYYYAFEEATGNFTDQVSGNNLTEHGSVGRVAGKIGNGTEYYDNAANYLESVANVGITGNSARTTCFWAEQDQLGNHETFVSWGTATTHDMWMVGFYNNAAYYLVVFTYEGDINTQVATTTNMDFHCVTFNGTSIEWYRNAVSIANVTAGFSVTTADSTLWVGLGQWYSMSFQGIIDELGIWNRTLAGSEVVYMYNGGAGMTYALPGTKITLLSPEDNTNFTINTINFSANVSDPNSLGIQNVTLEIVYPNGTSFYSNTNTSGLEGFYNWTGITIADGDWNWSVNAYDDADEIYESSMRFFNINTAPIINVTSPVNQTYTTSLINFNATSSLAVDVWIINYNTTNITISNSTLDINLLIEEGFYHLLLYANNSESGVWGLNDTIYFNVNLTKPIVTLVSPADNLNTANATILFEANTTTGNYTLNNATIYVWFNNGTLFQSETNDSIAGTSDANVSFNLSDFSLGIHKWNVQVNYENPGLGIYNSVFAVNNRTINIEATLSSITYNNHTYETKREIFKAEFEILPYSEISLAQLVYNGTNYTITNLTTTPILLMLQKSIDIPLNLNSFENETRSFFFRFTYGGGFVQETEEVEQNVSFINYQKCDATYNIQSLNFTFFNEINQTRINATANPTSFESSWEYWIGSGNIYKTYSYQNLGASANNYQFCIFPYIPNNYTFRVDGDIEFSAITFRENEYYLRNATLTNVSNDNLLYLLPTTHATKFFLTFKKGTSLIKGATITIQKYFTGLGEFKTVGIQLTDDDGEATMWGEVDKTYKFFIVQDGELLGVVERNAICAIAPCTLSIIIEDVPIDLFESYYETFGQNIVSTLSFNKTSKIITYNFVDTTGLANYFRLKVQRVMLNETRDVICNSQSFSTAGTLTCNLTGKTGEFKATTYISRSPELTDKVLSVIVDEDIIEGLGLIGVFLVMALIITIVFAAAIIGRGSPSVVLWALAGAIVLLKLAHLFPFTWAVVITLEVIIFFLISQVKT